MSVFGWLADNGQFYYLVWAFVLAALFTTRNLLDSREGGRSAPSGRHGDGRGDGRGHPARGW